ncbi:MAG: hypothetical protein P8L85_01385 [Rubripirellula sp.]|nr:hypothetical protein [Rubripirellula sp.]
MAGHGGLCRRSVRSRVSAAAMGWVCAFAITAVSAQDANIIDLRLKIQWQAPAQCYWKTQLELTDDQPGTSSISEVVNRGDSELNGSIELDDPPNRLLIQPRFAKKSGTVEFRIRGNRNAKLTIRLARLQTTENSSLDNLPSQELTLGELADLGEIHSHDTQQTDPNRPSWSLSRLPGDSLRTEGLPRGKTIAPEQNLEYTVHCNSMLQHASQQLVLHASLIRVDDGQTISDSRHIMQVDALGNSPAVTVDFQTPTTVGVYEVRSLLFKEDENIWSRIRRRDLPLLQQGQPVVVHTVNQSATELAPDQPDWEAVGEIKPSEPSWSVGTWIPQSTSRFIPGPEIEPSQNALASESYADKTVSLLTSNEVFQTALPVLQPAIPHRIRIRMAQNRPIHLRVHFGTIDSPSHSFVIVQDTVANSENPWLEHTWIHYPKVGEQIYFTNLSTDDAAIESIRVEAGPKRLGDSKPALANDSASPRRAVTLRVTDENWVEHWSNSTPLGRSDFQKATVVAQRIWRSSIRLADYAHQMNLTGVMLPAITQGSGLSNLHFDDPVQLAMQLLSKQSLQVYVSVRPTDLLAELEEALRSQPSRVAELTRDETNRSGQYDLLNPAVQQSLATWLHDLDARYKQYPHYAGLGLFADQGSHLQPPSDVERDPLTIARFAKSAGLQVNQLDLEARSELAQSDAFDDWIQAETHNAFDVITSMLSDRPALMLLPTESLVDLETTSKADWDLAFIIRDGNEQILSDRQLFSQQISDLADTNAKRSSAVLVRATTPTTNQGKIRLGWEFDLSQVMNQLEPNTLLIDQSVVFNQLDDELRDFFSAFTSLPAIPLADAPGSTPTAQTVHVKTSTIDDQLYVAIISSVPWPSEIDLETSASASWDSSTPLLLQPRSNNRIRVTVPAGQMVVLRASAASTKTIKLTGWTSRVGGGIQTLQRIKQQVTSVVERLGSLSDLEPSGQPRNGSFEQSGKMGLVGWLHAQHPPDCVKVDEREHFSGKQSVLLTTDPKSPSRTWLVTETIEPPQSGRLAVSIACLSERQENAPPHRLKVSIEASRNGQPIRFATEFEVPRDGKWNKQHVILEADGIHRGIVDSLRLTIDSLSTGKVWIDDVRLHEHFATEQEREELQSLAFLAVQGLQRSNLAPSGRLLLNPWAQHLLTLKHLNPTEHQSDSPPKPTETPGVAERLRTWLPRPLRF